jgi:hypothetical protein
MMGLPGYQSATQNPSTPKQANIPLNPATGQPFTQNDFMAGVNKFELGHATAPGDMQALYSQYIAGQMPIEQLSALMGQPASALKTPAQAGQPGGAPGTVGPASAGIATAGGAPGAAGQPGGGFGSLMTPFTGANLAQTPGYQFQLQQGLEALGNKAAAGGTLMSPNTQKDLINYAEGLAGTRYDTAFQEDMAQKQQQFNQLMGITGIGTGATNVGVNVGQNTAANIGGAQIGMANAAAGGILGQGAAQQQMYQNLAGMPGFLSSFYNKLPSSTPSTGTWNPNYSVGGQPMYSGYDVGGGPAYG